MPFFHATWKRNLPSIHRHGLGGAEPLRRNFECERGVYLSKDINAAAAFLLEACTIMDGEELEGSPMEALGEMVVIVIDDARIRRAALSRDPNVEHASYLAIYDGVIDVRGMPVVPLSSLYANPGREPDSESMRIC